MYKELVKYVVKNSASIEPMIIDTISTKPRAFISVGSRKILSQRASRMQTQVINMLTTSHKMFIILTTP